MIGKLNHIALVVPDLSKAAATYSNLFGASVSVVQRNEEQGISMVYVELPNTKIELLHPLDETSPIYNFLEKSPSGGMHHVCYEVEDIVAARDTLIANGARLLGDGEPTIGVHGNPILFLHPKDFFGTLIELEQVVNS